MRQVRERVQGRLLDETSLGTHAGVVLDLQASHPKHQQVQFLEAASVLINMNYDELGAEGMSESANSDSSKSSASPAVSWYSALQYPDPQNEDISFVETVSSLSLQIQS